MDHHPKGREITVSGMRRPSFETIVEGVTRPFSLSEGLVQVPIFIQRSRQRTQISESSNRMMRMYSILHIHGTLLLSIR